ncbi:TPR repeat-containing protein [Dethiosulfovibrio peptidovorans DSM 11002]|uniref:TPR repeat-containing protein n=1 Tax=Dethiosulfovibrio peptidovorans DSM 11002 TaxID=469381 RepID=D2Z8U9_9BACT|nr:tetratricopeptide repeat protein [Dethiosulfovibrio peptidovorans]EFC91896.1 TPR repeat-containing protein [Dethiosulfovibrio peptidovorans DSM 11002]
MEKNLEAWIREPRKKLDPDAMGFPIVSSDVDDDASGQSKEGFSSPIDFIKKSEAPAHSIEEIVPENTLDSLASAVFTDLGISDSVEIPPSPSMGKVDEETEQYLEEELAEPQLSSSSEPPPLSHMEEGAIRDMEDRILFDGEPAFIPEDISGEEEDPEGSKSNLPKKGEKTSSRRKYILLSSLALVGGAVLLVWNSIETPTRTLEEADRMYSSGEFEKAVSLYEEVEMERSLPLQSLIKKGEALLTAERYAEALDSFYGALALSPESPDIHRKIGSILSHLGSSAQAEKSYRETLRLDPSDNETRLELARVLLEKSQPLDVLQLIEEAPIEISGDEVNSLRSDALDLLLPVEDVISEDLSGDLSVSPDEFVAVSMDEVSEDSAVLTVEVPIEIVDEKSSEDQKEKTQPIKAEKVVEYEVASSPKVVPPKKTDRKQERRDVKRVAREETDKTELSGPSLEERHFLVLLSSSRRIGAQDSDMLRRLTDKRDVSSLFRLGKAYNMAGRFREALLFLEKGLLLNDKDSRLLLEAAYSCSSIGRDQDAMAMVQHVLTKKSGASLKGDPPSVLVYRSRNNWNIGWNDGDGTVKDATLYAEDEGVSIPGLIVPKIGLDMYDPLKKAIKLNPGGKELYIDFMALTVKITPSPPSRILKASAIAMEAHSLFVSGRKDEALILLDTVEELAPSVVFWKELRDSFSTKI